MLDGFQSRGDGEKYIKYTKYIESALPAVLCFISRGHDVLKFCSCRPN